MINKLVLKDEKLEELFNNRIIQNNNSNANSELFIYKNDVFKIYNGDSEIDNYNLNTINNIFSKYKYLSTIKELVLPKELLIYNNEIVGFSMPYIKGLSLEEIINNKLDKNYNMKEIFINLLNIIKKSEELPFEFIIGDMHEQNIIIDEDNNIKIIDPDSFIIDNNKICIDGEYLVGRYPNHYYDNSELMKVNSSIDYYSLLCIVLNYEFKDINGDISNPVNWLKKDSQFNGINHILNRVDNNFVLTENDIEEIIIFKNNLNYEYKEYDVEKEIKRVRKLLKK